MELNSYIDHTMLQPQAKETGIANLCDESRKYKFASVVVNPIHIGFAKENLKDSGIKICSVVGFPLGASMTEIKVAEARLIEKAGADEIDMVANIGWIQSRKIDKVAREVEEIRRALARRTVLKVILETPLTTPDLWPEAVEALISGGADFVKSATGFFGSTSVEHIRRLAAMAGGRVRIKAAGGIRTAAGALAMIEAGAHRIGCSASVAVMEDYYHSHKK